jgi:type III pantothenate kinase
MAGVNVALTALTQRAAKLAPVELTAPPSPIGRNTVHALQSGLLNGYAAMAEGMVSRFRSEIGADAKVVATGGLAETIAPLTKVFDAVAPWLTLDGLRLIWEMNRP